MSLALTWCLANILSVPVQLVTYAVCVRRQRGIHQKRGEDDGSSKHTCALHGAAEIKKATLQKAGDMG